MQHLNEVQDAELAFGGVHTENKVEGCVMAIDELGVDAANEASPSACGLPVKSVPSAFEKVADCVRTLGDQLEALPQDLLLHIFRLQCDNRTPRSKSSINVHGARRTW